MSAHTHTIRLRGPWEFRDSSDTTWQDVRLPDDWEALSARHPRGEFRRRFNQPTNLVPQDQVAIVISQPGCELAIWLNEIPLSITISQDGDVIAPIAHHLQLNNLLRIHLSRSSDASKTDWGLWQPVVLRIVSEQ